MVRYPADFLQLETPVIAMNRRFSFPKSGQKYEFFLTDQKRNVINS